MKKKVSIIILNWNGKEHLKKCLESIKKISYKPLEIIVVDNDSRDLSVQMVKKSYAFAKVIVNKKNIGYSAGNNVGINAATGEYIFILNNDTEVTKDFLDPLVKLMESDKQIGCVQPRLIYASDHTLLNAVGSYLTATGFLYHYGYRKKTTNAQYMKPLTIYSAKGAAMLLRKSAIAKTGLLDEDFFIFFEETDLCHRLWLFSYLVVYEPKSVIYHYEAVDTSRQMKEFTRNYLSFRNRICSYLKNLEMLSLVKLFLVLFPIYGFLFVLYFIQGKFNLSYAMVKGILWNIFHLPQTMKKRSIIQNTRKISDKNLFTIIKRSPHLQYYYYLFTTLKNLQQEDSLRQNIYPDTVPLFMRKNTLQ